MTKIVVKKLIWDEFNKEHIKKHNLTEKEVGTTGENIIYHKKTHKQRYLLIGRAGTRMITLILSRQGRGIYYLVTARDSDRKERRRAYEKEKQNT